MNSTDVRKYINELADRIRKDGCMSIDGTLYCYDQFPPGFWRKLAKEVNVMEGWCPPKSKPAAPPLRDERESDWR